MTIPNEHRRNPYVSLICAFVLSAVSTTGSAQPIVIDDFSVDQAPITASTPMSPAETKSSSVIGSSASIIGGERDMEIRVLAGSDVTGEVNGGVFRHSTSVLTTGESLLMWDGPDGLPASTDFNFTGLGGIDLTAGNTQDAVHYRILSSVVPGLTVFTVYTDEFNFSTFTQAIPNSITTPIDFMHPYIDFTVGGGIGADFSNVGALSAFIAEDFGLFGLDTVFDFFQTTSTLQSTPMPEPTTLSSFLIGLILLLMTHRRWYASSASQWFRGGIFSSSVKLNAMNKGDAH